MLQCQITQKLFKSTSAEIKRVVQAQEVQQYVIKKGIMWNFTVEKSSSGEILGKNDQEYQKMSKKTLPGPQ